MKADVTRRHAAAWRRWSGVLLRSVHLVAVSWLAVALHAAGDVTSAATALLGSGSLLLGLELADRRLRLDEAAGAIVLVKLAMAGLMAWQPASAVWIFWPLVFVSSLASHAPRRWRHWPTRMD